MKKIITLMMVVMMTALLSPMHSQALPFWIKFKLGILAKWKIGIGGDCEPGWGLCLVLGDNSGPCSLGFDNEVNQFSIKIPKDAPEAKYFSNSLYELKEDSPVEPALVAKFTKFDSKGQYLVLKKGVYKVVDTGAEYIVTMGHYLKAK